MKKIKKLFLATIAVVLFQVGFSQAISVTAASPATGDISKPELSKE